MSENGTGTSSTLLPGCPQSRRRKAVLGAVVGLALAIGLVAYDSSGSGAFAAPSEPSLAEPIDPASGDVSAFPAPGTATVSTHAELSFRGTADPGTVTVTGADSGEHRGEFVEHSDGDGVSWVPDEPFTQGEEVTVSTDLAIRGGEDGTYTLTVAEYGDRPPLEDPPVTRSVLNADVDEGEVPAEDVRHYTSEPDLEPPVVEVSGPEAGTTTPPAAGADASPGLTAIGVKNGFGQKGPMLVDDAGEPAWFHPTEGVDARDVKVQELDGEPVLTWWEGLQPVGYGYGEAVVVDQTYTEIARFDMASGYDADSHEMLLTDEGTAFLLAYEPVRMDTSGAGGSGHGQAVDNIIQEIDLETGSLLFEWHSIGQVGLDESYLEMDDSPYDYFHLNAIDVDDDGDLLLSARHVCGIYKIDRETGSLLWRLGGTESDFAMGEGTTFLKQHDVRRNPDGTISLLDNGGTCGETTREVTRGLTLDVDEESMTAEVAREVVHPDELWAESQANYREIPGVGAQIGWGSLSRWSLFDSDGELLLDATIPGDLRVSSYRAQRVEWTGTPRTDPVAVYDRGTVYASWNGATEVAEWRVRAERPGLFESVTAERAGFETAVDVPDRISPDGLIVEALDADGEVLGSTLL